MRNQTITHSPDSAFQALADPTRRMLLDLLRRGGRPAGAIARGFPVSRPAISRHLRILRSAGLVRERRMGRHRYYELEPAPLKAVDRWLEHYRVFWDARLAGLKSYLEAEATPTSRAKTKSSKARNR